MELVSHLGSHHQHYHYDHEQDHIGDDDYEEREDDRGQDLGQKKLRVIVFIKNINCMIDKTEKDDDKTNQEHCY